MAHQHQHQKQEQELRQKEQLLRCGSQFTVAAVPLLLFLLSSTPPTMAQLPDKGQCISTASGQLGAINQFAPCAGGPSESCCSTVQGFAGPGSALGYCLCYPDLQEQLLVLVESDPTAKRFGVTRNDVTSILQACNVPFASGTGGAACPAVGAPGPTRPVVAGTAPPAAAGVPETTVAVSAPGTTVGVTPSGATTVRAPGTTVAVGGAARPAPAMYAAPAPAPGPAPAPSPATRAKFNKGMGSLFKRFCQNHPWHPKCKWM